MKVLSLDNYISEKKSISPLTIKQIKELEFEPEPLKNPTIYDIECFDISKTREGNYYVYLTPKCGKPKLSIPNFESNFYRVYEHIIIPLGIENYRKNLTCMSGENFDIIAVYRILDPDKCSKMNIYELYDEIREELNLNKI